MALWHGVSYLTGKEIEAHECDARCREEQGDPWILIPCPACLARGCPRCSEVREARGFLGLYTCPQSRDLGDAPEYLELWQLYPGTLPFTGGLYDQPAAYVAAMRVLARAKVLIMEAVKRTAEKHGD